MTKTLILIPAMYGKDELIKVLGQIPDDFEQASFEFWSYVENKLRPYIGRVYAFYSEKSSEKEVGPVLRQFKERGAKFCCITNNLLTAEAEAWLEIMKNTSNHAVFDLFMDNVKEQNEYAIKVINKTLGEKGIGVLFIDPARNLLFPEDIRVIRMCPFDPVDYVNRHITKLNIEKKKNLTSN